MRPLVVVALIALTAAGCGGDKSTAKPETSSTAALQSSGSDCDFREITAGRRLEGKCTARGVAVTVADRAHWLRGKQYSVRVHDVGTTDALRTSSEGTLRPNGKFVVVTLDVKNTLDVPHPFDRGSDLVFLFVDGKYFSENGAAEGDPALDAFRNRAAALQPDEVVRGAAVFDVPREQAANLHAAGSNVIFVNYADKLKGFPTGSEPLGALGYIRLWK